MREHNSLCQEIAIAIGEHHRAKQGTIRLKWCCVLGLLLEELIESLGGEIEGRTFDVMWFGTEKELGPNALRLDSAFSYAADLLRASSRDGEDQNVAPAIRRLVWYIYHWARDVGGAPYVRKEMESAKIARPIHHARIDRDVRTEHAEAITHEIRKRRDTRAAQLKISF